MTLGTWTWSDSYAGSISLPVYPSQTTGDMIIIPPGMAPGSASALILTYSFWDPSRTYQIDSLHILSRGLATYFVDAVAVEHLLNPAGAGGISSLPDVPSGISYGTNARVNTGADGFLDHSAVLTDVPALLNAGGTLRYRASADSATCTVDFVVCAAILSADGLVSVSYQAFLANFASRGVFSGSITTSPPPGGKDNAGFLFTGANFDDSGAALSAPDVSLDPAWLNLQARAYSSVWGGLGYLTAISPDPATTDTYSVFVPAFTTGFQPGIVVCHPTLIGGGGSVQVIG